MSLPDHLLEDDDERECPECGAIFLRCGGKGLICWGCAERYMDEYADEKISEGRHR